MHLSLTRGRGSGQGRDPARGLLRIALARLVHRRLVSVLCAMAIALGVALAVALLQLRDHALALVAQAPRGFDLIIGPRGSGVDLTLNTLYQCARSPGTIPWPLAQDIAHGDAWRGMAWDAVPLAVGDSVGGCPILGTTPAFFAHPDPAVAARTACWDPRTPPTLSAGRWFRTASIDAVIGAEVPARAGLTLGAWFRPVHGAGADSDPADVHDRRFQVCGVLAPTGTSLDRCVVIPIEGFWSIDEHQEGMLDQATERTRERGATAVADGTAIGPASVDAAGCVHLQLPEHLRRISALLVRSRGPYAAQLIAYRLAAGTQASAIAPAAVLAQLMGHLLLPLLALAGALVGLLLAVAGLLVGCTTFQAVLAQAPEIALLRALGATRTWILALVTTECVLVGGVGVVLGLVPAHLLLAAAATWLPGTTGIGWAWWQPGTADAGVALAALILAAISGAAPAWRACRIAVAEQLC